MNFIFWLSVYLAWSTVMRVSPSGGGQTMISSWSSDSSIVCSSALTASIFFSNRSVWLMA
jgi:hypothetical protein